MELVFVSFISSLDNFELQSPWDSCNLAGAYWSLSLRLNSIVQVTCQVRGNSSKSKHKIPDIPSLCNCLADYQNHVILSWQDCRGWAAFTPRKQCEIRICLIVLLRNDRVCMMITSVIQRFVWFLARTSSTWFNTWSSIVWYGNFTPSATFWVISE